jgi:hypothetical protein
MNRKSAPMILGFAVLAGCASTSPNVDKHYGEAVSTARVAQTFMVHPPYAPEALTGMDGKAAKEAVGRYLDSFKAPPPTINVINIGGGLGAQ